MQGQYMECLPPCQGAVFSRFSRFYLVSISRIVNLDFGEQPFFYEVG